MYISSVMLGFPVKNLTPISSRSISQSITPQLKQDTFVKSSQVSFGSATSKSAPLKKLKNMIDPYSGITMLSSEELSMAEKALSKCKDAKTTIKVLSRYTKNMLPVEKEMFEIFKGYSKKNPSGTFVDCLNSLRPEAHKKLMLEEFDILDKVDDMSRGASPDLALAVRHKTTKCRDVILKDDPEKPFKRKTLITSLDEITPNSAEQNLFNSLKEQVEYLPTSGTSKNAFIVKYTDKSKPRTHGEIAKRLLRPALQSAEHIHPDSLGGANALGNFILTSAGRNSERGNMPLEKFIEKYPNIPNYMQTHVDQIMDNVYKGNLKGYEDYPYLLKESLNNESKGLINIDLSKYKYSKEEAENLVKSANIPKTSGYNFDPNKI